MPASTVHNVATMTTDAMATATDNRKAILSTDHVSTRDSVRRTRRGVERRGAPPRPYEAGAPDLFTFGKVMGGGFPAAAFGGRADIMAHLAPEGPVYQAGTLSGNPVATAAGLATLRGCTPELYDRLGVVSTTISEAASAALSAQVATTGVLERTGPSWRLQLLRRAAG